MAALDWLSRQTTLEALRASASATDRQIIDGALQLLGLFGPKYSTAFGPDVDAAKAAGDLSFAGAVSTWQSSASTVHAQALRAVRHAESLAGAPGPSLTFDPASAAAILLRLKGAKALPAAALLTTLLAAHEQAVTGIYAAKPTPYFTAPYGGPPVLPMAFIAGAPSLQPPPLPPQPSSQELALQKIEAARGIRSSNTLTPWLLSVRDFEIYVLGPLLQLIDAQIAELEFT